VAINKIDKPEAQLERVKRQLTENRPDARGNGRRHRVCGSIAKKKIGIEKLLETILLVADLRELKANPDAPRRVRCWNRAWTRAAARWLRFSYKMARLNSGDFFICGSVFGKVRAMFDDRGRVVKDAPLPHPSKCLVA